jgi:biopolymer transport protein ExbB/TolQ
VRWPRFGSDGQRPSISRASLLAAPLIALAGTIVGMWVAFHAIRTVSETRAAMQGILAAVLCTAVGTGLAIILHFGMQRIRKH